MQPAVLGRIKIDNYLLSLPHANPAYDETTQFVKSGGLIDTTNFGGGEERRLGLVLGIHLGRDGYVHRVKREHLKDGDVNWNVPFLPNLFKSRVSLVYADYRFRREGSGD